MNVPGCDRALPKSASPQLALRTIAPATLLVLLATASFAGEQTTPVTPYGSPIEIMRKVVQNEVKAANDDVNRILFRGVKTTPKGSYTRLYVMTSQATTGEVIAYNGQPLPSDQRQAEESRIERIINNPDELKKKCQQDRENAERTLRILRALPDAFLFENAGEEQGTETVGRAGARLLKFNFHPNPAYQAPSRVEEVLTGVQGYVLVDPVQFRLAAIDGTLFKDVAFGWGILGHLNKGGRFEIQQKNVSDDLWQASSITFNFTGKLLLLKAINVATTEVFSDFQRIPSNLTFVQALQFMKHQSSMMAADWIATNLRAKGSFAAK
jgi:hypothetical protein